MITRCAQAIIIFWNICVLFILFVTIHGVFSAVFIEQCNDGWTTIVEGRTNVITCSGISEDRNVIWWFKLPNADYTYIGTCRTDNKCSNNFAAHFNVNRTGDKSSLSLSLNERTYARMTVRCQQENRIFSNDYHECALAVKSQVTLSNCRVEVRVSSWSLYGSCFLYKMYDSLSRYDCYWVLGQAIFSDFVASSLQPYIDQKTSLNYWRGNCSFTSRLPNQEGKYKYYIFTKPEPADSYSYELVISSPGKLNISSCPTFVQENANLTCKCEANPPGSPPAVVTWKEHTDSATLELFHVHRADNGRIFICHLTWGTSQSANFKLRVAYGPDRAELSESTFKEGTDETFTNLTCNASSYFPDVHYTWSVPCHMEVLVDKASVCSTTFQDQETEVTCTAVNTQFPALKAVAVVTVYQEVPSQQSQDKLFLLALIGGILGILTILSISAGLTFYIKRRKGSKVASRFTDYTNETYITSAEVSPGVLANSQNFSEDEGNRHTEEFRTQDAFRKSDFKHGEDVDISPTKERGDTSTDIYAVPDKSTKIKQRRDSRQTRDRGPSATIDKPIKMSVLGENGNVRRIFNDSANVDHSGSGSIYENMDTHQMESTADSADSTKRTISRKLQSTGRKLTTASQ